MKLVKTASGKQTIKISKKEWQNIGKKAGWIKTASMFSVLDYFFKDTDKEYKLLQEYKSNIFDLEVQIKDLAEEQRGVEEGEDSYGSDYITQNIGRFYPDFRKDISEENLYRYHLVDSVPIVKQYRDALIKMYNELDKVQNEKVINEQSFDEI